MSDDKKPELPSEDDHHCSARIEKILNHFEEHAFKITAPKDINDRPIYATTLYLATCNNIQMHCGTFTAYVFQDIIHKGYIIALAYGDIFNTKTFYTRVHSSCITSETLGGCDCDCSEQLEGALTLIAQKGVGMLFYLMQEGRGVGYIAKARDRMLVQASNDEISTFEAYHLLGLNRDYRQYRNVPAICKMLGIDPEFILLTNNPNKVKTMRELGVKIQRTETLEFDPGPYNMAYLKSKLEGGHILKKILKTNIPRVRPPQPVIPFKPHAINEAKRFILTASYFLPIKPIDDEIILNDTEFHNFFKKKSIDDLIESANPILLDYKLLRDNRYKIKIHKENFCKFKQEYSNDPLCGLINIPYWFRIYVYFDIVTDEDFVVLTYGDAQPNDIPVVRIQSESLFNRFPLVDTYNRDKYKAAIKEIMNYGVGIILLLYTDGRGAGFGAHAQDIMLTQQGYSANTAESYNFLGINYDLRDYQAAMTILTKHLQHNTVQMVMNSPSSLVKKTAYTQVLNEMDIKVERWIFLEEQSKLKHS